MPIAEIFKAWDKFWFSQGSPLPVALYRIMFGWLCFWNYVFLLPDLYVWLGSRGITTRQGVCDWTGMNGLTVFNFFPDNDAFMTTCFAIFMLASVALCLGYKSRLAAAIIFVGLNAVYHRDPFILNSGDCYMRVSCFWLMFAPSSKALSLERLLNKHNDDVAGAPAFENYKPVSIWPLRLLQLQLTLVYCHTFVKKFWGSAWIDGSAVYYSSRVEDLHRFPLPFVFDHMWTIKFLTWSTLGLEFALFTLIWIKEIRYWVLAAAVAFHLTIEYHMNIPFFEWLMIVSYVLFVYPTDLARWLRFAKSRLVKKKGPEAKVLPQS
jgi:hypothetical protein